MAYIVMADIVMAYIVMAYIVVAYMRSHGLHSYSYVVVLIGEMLSDLLLEPLACRWPYRYRP